MGKRNPNGYGCVTKLKVTDQDHGVLKLPFMMQKDVPNRLRSDMLRPKKANILLAQYNNNPWNIDREKVTLLDLYHRWEK